MSALLTQAVNTSALPASNFAKGSIATPFVELFKSFQIVSQHKIIVKI
jgi:hypothetical protein